MDSRETFRANCEKRRNKKRDSRETTNARNAAKTIHVKHLMTANGAFWIHVKRFVPSLSRLKK